MALADLANTQRAKKGPPCSVCTALATIPPDEAAGLVKMLSDPKRRYTEICKQIAADKDTPLHIAGSTLARHARGDCDAHTRLR